MTPYYDMHEAIEGKVFEEFHKLYPPDKNPERINQEAIIKGMREFYYHRMMSTASLLLSGASFSVTIIALLIAIIALYK
ncbi:hypothetical protein C5471_20800 [Photorhabdus tasmaniensis]|uniref:SMODS and SLOG-associating 2TM effector domain-containing protein n=1 Tax=Photorhabdus tasmaniensis TaxID=1004159 RepID=A0ABX0GP92_9GAMM|nr:hypothetical protein [Photorhabdus tasmaniensis]